MSEKARNDQEEPEDHDCYIQQVCDTIHVFPMADVLEHNTSGVGECWCQPEIDYDGYGNRVCIHQQFTDDTPPFEGDKVH
jgi:hypothetical protein